MTWGFRLHFLLSGHQRLTADDDASEVTIETGDGAVILRSTKLRESAEPVTSIIDLSREPIRNVGDLALFGSGYAAAEDAEASASRWQARLMTALTSLRMGADFGARAVGGSYFTEHGQRLVRQIAGIPQDDQRPVLAEKLGVHVFEENAKPIFAGGTAIGVGTSPVQSLGDALDTLVSSGYLPSEQEQLALDTFGLSHFAESPDTKFIMLMVAMETLIEQQPRPQQARRYVADLISRTKDAGLDADETRSLVSSLTWLKLESINQAGRKLARTLVPRTYADEPPDTFFGKCYEIRSKLVHGHTDRPAARDVATRGEELRRFVADLLSGPLLK